MTCIGKIACLLGIVLLLFAGVLLWTLWEAQYSGFRLISLEEDIRIMIPILAVIGVAAMVMGRRSGRADKELKKGLGLNDSSSDKQ